MEFYEAWAENKIQPFYKDEGNLPEDELYDAVGLLKLTRTTYYPYIEEQSKKGVDVVVTYTAKECKPCKEFKPDYNSVYKRFK